MGQRIGERQLVDDAAAGRVDQHRIGLHQRQARASIRPRVSASAPRDADKIALGKQLVESTPRRRVPRAGCGSRPARACRRPARGAPRPGRRRPDRRCRGSHRRHPCRQRNPATRRFRRASGRRGRSGPPRPGAAHAASSRAKVASAVVSTSTPGRIAHGDTARGGGCHVDVIHSHGHGRDEAQLGLAASSLSSTRSVSRHSRPSQPASSSRSPSAGKQARAHPDVHLAAARRVRGSRSPGKLMCHKDFWHGATVAQARATKSEAAERGNRKPRISLSSTTRKPRQRRPNRNRWTDMTAP
jgi:hypothetical protein